MRLGSERPDMLITDLDLPGMDGFMMIQSLRASSSYGEVPVVVISGLSPPAIAAGGLPLNIRVLPKPIPFGELRSAVEDALFN